MRFAAFIGVSMVALAGVANATNLGFCNNNSADSRTNTSIQPFAGYRQAITIPSAGLAPSITLPSAISANGILHIQVTDNTPISATFCLDGAGPNNVLCNSGTPPAASKTGTDAWQPIPAPASFSNPIRVLSVVSGTLYTPSATFIAPATMYISNSTAVTQTLHLSICQEY